MIHKMIKRTAATKGGMTSCCNLLLSLLVVCLSLDATSGEPHHHHHHRESRNDDEVAPAPLELPLERREDAPSGDMKQQGRGLLLNLGMKVLSAGDAVYDMHDSVRGKVKGAFGSLGGAIKKVANKVNDGLLAASDAADAALSKATGSELFDPETTTTEEPTTTSTEAPGPFSAMFSGGGGGWGSLFGGGGDDDNSTTTTTTSTTAAP